MNKPPACLQMKIRKTTRKSILEKNNKIPEFNINKLKSNTKGQESGMAVFSRI